MNYEAYYSELDRAMYDKLWWLDKVEDGVDTILDFGCSNGAMYQSIHAVMPERFSSPTAESMVSTITLSRLPV